MAKYEKDTHLINGAIIYMVGDLHEYDLKVAGVAVSSVPVKVLKMFDKVKNAKTPATRKRELQKLENYLRKLQAKKKVDFKLDEAVKKLKISDEEQSKLRRMVGYSGTITGSLINIFEAYMVAKEKELKDAKVSERKNEPVEVDQRVEKSKQDNRVKTKSGTIINRHSKPINEEKEVRPTSFISDTSIVLKEMKKAMRSEDYVDFSVDDYGIKKKLEDFVLLNKLLNQKDADPEMIKRLLVEQVCAFNDLRCKKCNEQEKILLDVYYSFNPLKVLAKYEKKYPNADVREAINGEMIKRLDNLFGYSEYYGIQEYNLDRIGLAHIVTLRTELMTPSEISSLYYKYSHIRKGWNNLAISHLQNIFTSSIKNNVEYDRLIGEKATAEEKMAEDYMICAVYFGEIPARFESREELVDYINNNVTDTNMAAKMRNNIMAVENLRVTKIKPNEEQYGTGTSKK